MQATGSVLVKYRAAMERDIVRGFLARLEPLAAAAGVSRQLLRALRILCASTIALRFLGRLVELIGGPTARGAESVSHSSKAIDRDDFADDIPF